MKVIKLFKNKGFFYRHPRKIASVMLGLFLVLGVISALSLSKLRTEYNMKQFLPPNHPLMMADDKVKARFQLPELEPVFALVTLPPDRGHWLEKKNADELQKVTNNFAGKDGVSFSVSIANVEGASSTKEGLTVGR